MDIRGPRHAPRDHGGIPPPTISIYDDDRYPSSPRAFGGRAGSFAPFQPSLSSSTPMGIPNAPSHDAPPPPLPPPRFVPVEGPQPDHSEYLSRRRQDSYNDSSYPDSAFGSSGASLRSRASQEDGPDFRRRESSTSTLTGRDEGYSSLSSYASSGSRDKGPTSFRVHDQYQFRSTADAAYDNQLLKKLDVKRPMDNRSPPPSRLPSISSSTQSGPPMWSNRPHLQLPILSLPTRSKSNSNMLDSPHRFTDTPHSAVSPLSTPFSQYGQDYRSPIEPMSATDFDRSPFSRSRRQNSGPFSDDVTVSTEGGYDNDIEFPLEETNRLRQVHIDEGQHSRLNSFDYHAAGLKRRASSPPVDDHMLHHASSQSELFRRREAISRGSPAPRLTVNPQHGSISSVSSAGRSGSYASMSTATSMTSSHSFGRRSPVGLSPGGVSPTDAATSPFPTPNSLTMSPRTTIVPRTAAHQRAPSDQKMIVSPRKLNEPTLRTNGAVAKMQGFYMCECCPKKPKKFDTTEELSAHEAEKQYECSYCHSRFKNKNEAERHQNSLHVRRHSWSCSALTGYDRAFHESTSRPGEADTCGYCGEEFARTGLGPTGHPRQVSDQDWDERVRHLQDQHKFRECNSSKKFYRADHFRQHLKHSHAGTSGKWTNMLENACMEEEAPLPPGR